MVSRGDLSNNATLVPRFREEEGSFRDADGLNAAVGLLCPLSWRWAASRSASTWSCLERSSVIRASSARRNSSWLHSAGADDVDEQASLGHCGDKAGVARACGGAPRRVAAS
jgi:hypothetical protein